MLSAKLSVQTNYHARIYRFSVELNGIVGRSCIQKDPICGLAYIGGRVCNYLLKYIVCKYDTIIIRITTYLNNSYLFFNKT